MPPADDPGASVAIVEVTPERGSITPGQHVVIETTIHAPRPGTIRLVLELLDLDRVIVSIVRRRRLVAGATTVRWRLPIPPVGRRGYGVRVRAFAADGTLVSSGHAAIEAIAGWWESPRHVALIDHTDAGTRQIPGLRAWNVRVAQAYDWMWRHYRYEPPGHEDPFRDTLGRPVSHRALRATIRAAALDGTPDVRACPGRDPHAPAARTGSDATSSHTPGPRGRARLAGLGRPGSLRPCGR